jgi:broad specificity phosphatase PhoE
VSTRVYLLRHAETATPHVFHGAESDVALSERGRRQAAALAPALAPLEPAAVVSSAMRRAIDTATPLAAACGQPLRIEPDLHERKVGTLGGTSVHGGGVWPETVRRWTAGDIDFASPGAESFAQIRDRIVPIWERLTDEYADRPFVIVAHGVVCRVLILSVVEGFSVADWPRLAPTANVAVNELVGEGNRWHAVRINAHVLATECTDFMATDETRIKHR